MNNETMLQEWKRDNPEPVSFSECSSCGKETDKRKEYFVSGFNGNYSWNEVSTVIKCSECVSLAIEKQIPPRFRENLMEINMNGGVVLIGGVGTGKTQMLYNMFYYKKLNDKDKSSRFYSLPEMFFDIKQGKFEREEAILQDCKNADYLFLDDLGVEKNSDYNGEMLYHIVNYRYEQMKHIAISTNLERGQLQANYPRVFSRLLEMCKFVNTNGKDKRLKQKNATI
jgi:DNA replication protein DnaC